MRLSNTSIYSVHVKAVRPEVPMFFIEEQNKWVENPFDPDYNTAIELYENYYKPESAIRFLLDSYDAGPIDLTEEQILMLDTIRDADETHDFAYKKYILFANGIGDLVDNSLLTEQRVYKYFEPLEKTATRGGVDILEHGLKFSIELATTTLPLIIGGYQLVHPVDEMSCCKDSNIDWMKWLRCEFTLDEMAQTVALWRINRILNSHRDDEAAIYSEREAKKKH